MFWIRKSSKKDPSQKERKYRGCTTEQLALFLMGLAVNESGMYINEILEQDNEWWEKQQDYICWVFPINEKSSIDENAPVLQLPNMLDAPYIDDAYIRFRKYLKETDWKKNYYNRLRITRVLKSLCMFNRIIIAREFLSELLSDEDPELDVSKQIWENAVQVYNRTPTAKFPVVCPEW